VPQWVKIADLVARLEQEAAPEPRASASSGPCLLDVLPDYLSELRKSKPASFAIRLGKALEKRVATCFGCENYRLERRIDGHTKQKGWRVVKEDAGSAGSAGSVSLSSRSDVGKEEMSNREKEKETLPALPASPSSCTDLPVDPALSPPDPLIVDSLADEREVIDL
jgi:hypothetical protein